MRITFHIGTYTITIVVPSLDKGRHGFDGQKCAHTASSPLTIRKARQGEKDKKRRKDTLSGVFTLVNRW